MNKEQLFELQNLIKGMVTSSAHPLLQKMVDELVSDPYKSGHNSVHDVLCGDAWDRNHQECNRGDVFVGIFAGIALSYAITNSSEFRDKVKSFDEVRSAVKQVMDLLKKPESEEPPAPEGTKVVEYKFVAQGPSTVQ